MKKRLLPGLITLLAAQPAFSLDLVEAYEQALSYDSGIASAMAQFQAQQATSDVSKSALLPKISAVGSASYTRFKPRNIPGGQTPMSWCGNSSRETVIEPTATASS